MKRGDEVRLSIGHLFGQCRQARKGRPCTFCKQLIRGGELYVAVPFTKRAGYRRRRGGLGEFGVRSYDQSSLCLECSKRFVLDEV